MMYDTCVCTLVHEKYSQATQILFREDILLFLTFCFCISTKIISLSQKKKIFFVVFVQNQDLLAPLQKASSTSKKSTLYNGDNGTAIMNLIFQMKKTSVILLRTKSLYLTTLSSRTILPTTLVYVSAWQKIFLALSSIYTIGMLHQVIHQILLNTRHLSYVNVVCFIFIHFSWQQWPKDSYKVQWRIFRNYDEETGCLGLPFCPNTLGNIAKPSAVYLFQTVPCICKYKRRFRMRLLWATFKPHESF